MPCTSRTIKVGVLAGVTGTVGASGFDGIDGDSGIVGIPEKDYGLSAMHSTSCKYNN